MKASASTARSRRSVSTLQEHVPPDRPRPARGDRAAAEYVAKGQVVVRLAEHAALPGRHGGLATSAHHLQPSAPRPRPRREADAGAVREALVQGPEERLPRRRSGGRGDTASHHALCPHQEAQVAELEAARSAKDAAWAAVDAAKMAQRTANVAIAIASVAAAAAISAAAVSLFIILTKL